MWMLFEVITIMLIITLALFIHEMGHAVAAVLRNKKAKAEIYMGSSSPDKKLKLRLGRITVYLTIAFSGFCRLSNPEELPPSTHKQRLIFTAGGPIASLVGFATLYFASHFFSGTAGIIIYNIAFASLIIFATTVIPFTYPSFLRHLGGYPNDALQFLNELKYNRKQRNAVS